MYEVALLHAAAMHVESLKLEPPCNRICESSVRFALVSNRLRSIKHLCRGIYLESFMSFFPELITCRKPPISLGKLIIVPRNRLIIATLIFNGDFKPLRDMRKIMFATP